MSGRPWQSITIYDGNDHQKLAELQATVTAAQRAHAVAKQTGNPRMGDDDINPQVALDNLRTFVGEAAERASEVRVHAVGKVDFKKLRKEHPPRKVTLVVDGEDQEVDDPEDAPFGVNTDTFPLALLMFVDSEDSEIRTVTVPALKGPDLERYLNKELTEGQFDQAWTTAYYLNSTSAPDPKAWIDSVDRLASAVTTD